MTMQTSSPINNSIDKPKLIVENLFIYARRRRETLRAHKTQLRRRCGGENVDKNKQTIKSMGPTR
jgi:hypothetical protein